MTLYVCGLLHEEEYLNDWRSFLILYVMIISCKWNSPTNVQMDPENKYGGYNQFFSFLLFHFAVTLWMMLPKQWTKSDCLLREWWAGQAGSCTTSTFCSSYFDWIIFVFCLQNWEFHRFVSKQTDTRYFARQRTPNWKLNLSRSYSQQEHVS